LKDVVALVVAHHLEALAQAGWSNNAKLRTVRQENDPSFRSQVELDDCERLSDAVHLHGRGALIDRRTNNSGC